MIAAAAPISFFIFCLSLFPLQGEEAIFTPPAEWKPIEKKFLAPSVKNGFFTKSTKEFCPSINLTEEKVSITLEKYIKSVKKIHEEDPNNRWRNLGSFQTRAGKACLTSLDLETPLGKARLLQAILLKNGTAYLITGAALQEEFASYQNVFLEAFRSFDLVDSAN